MTEKDLMLLQAVVETLNELQISGYDSMVRVIGSINTLRDIIQRNTEEETDGR